MNRVYMRLRGFLWGRDWSAAVEAEDLGAVAGGVAEDCHSEIISFFGDFIGRFFGGYLFEFYGFCTGFCLRAAGFSGQYAIHLSGDDAAHILIGETFEKV